MRNAEGGVSGACSFQSDSCGFVFRRGEKLALGKKSLCSFSHPDFRPYSYPVCPKDVENGGDGDENFIAIKFILWYYHF